MAKSEFILAFNEIAETRRLPREVILEALKAALTSAYRRNANVSQAQHVEVRIDEKVGTPTIWVEKEVVDSVQTALTEVDLETARQIDPNVQIGDTLLVEDTPEDFGRIAAQTAKQVILQRMREAERAAQYEEYRERIGDLVTGTVQSESGDSVTIGLGRSEASLPRSQQMPGERYRTHDKVRAYVMEVKQSNRGPQIIVSRTHRNMLRRLLEYEVPEIYNGTVEIKAIAREPGARSKVAVASNQPGADPVGACVGMRGMRIQSIVKELNNEKIDVIEWNADQQIFISKALSPARVSAVFLDDDPEGGRTAIVVVPDDQLSLAIGREGQNARLAAKLTGWRIDIKSVTEATQDAYALIGGVELADLAAGRSDLIEQVGLVLEKKAANRPINPEDYELMTSFVKLVENYRLGLREAERSEWRARREEARSRVPALAYNVSLEDTGIPLRLYNVLAEAGYNNAGDVIEQLYFDAERLLGLPGIPESAAEDIAKLAEEMELAEHAQEQEALVEAASVEGLPAEELEAAVEEGMPEAAMQAEPVGGEGIAVEPAAETDEEELARARRAELVARMLAAGMEVPASEGEAEELLAEAAAEYEASVEALLAAPGVAGEEELIDLEEDEMEEELTEEQRAELEAKRAKQRRRQLVFDENLGRVVAKRRRKKSRQAWEEGWEDEGV
jgi:N utilization substance protein A